MFENTEAMFAVIIGYIIVSVFCYRWGRGVGTRIAIGTTIQTLIGLGYLAIRNSSDVAAARNENFIRHPNGKRDPAIVEEFEDNYD